MNATALFLLNLLGLIDRVLDLYIYMVVISAVMNWLVALNIINGHNRFVQTVGDFFYRITEPPLRVIRHKMRPFNGIDLSPLVLIFGIYLIEIILHYIVDLLIGLIIK